MRRITITTTLAVAIGIAGAGDAHAFGGMIAVGMNQAAEVGDIGSPFKATARLETAEQNIDTVIYYENGRIRDELRVGGQNMVWMQNVADKTNYMLMPAQRMYMEFAPGQQSDQVQEFRLVEREVVGREEVNGFDTTKYKVIYEGPDGKYGGFTWFTDDNIAVKAFMISEVDGERERVQFNITALERGDQPDDLFVIPAGYRKFEMPGMGSMIPGAGAMGGGESGGWPGQPEDKSLPEEIGEAAKEGAEEAAREETKQSVKDEVKKGIRKLFGG